MGTKTVKFNRESIATLPDNKPVEYEILNRRGNANYIGKAKRGNVRDEIGSYLGKIPGAEVKIRQYPTVREAERAEVNAIKHKQPPYNKRGK